MNIITYLIEIATYTHKLKELPKISTLTRKDVDDAVLKRIDDFESESEMLHKLFFQDTVKAK